MKKNRLPDICVVLFALFILSPFLFSAFLLADSEGIPKSALLIFRYSKTFHTGVWNALLYAVVITAGQMAVAVLAAYAFSCFTFKGRDLLFAVVILVMMMPHQATVVPSYILLQRLHMIDTRGAVILPQIFAPFCVFLLRQNMIHTDPSILEAAEIDGANPVKKLLWIVLPVNKGSLCSLFLLKISENWCLYEAPVSFTTNREIQPLSVLIPFSASDLGLLDILLAGILMCIPILIIYFLLGDSLVESLGRAALK